MRLFYLVATCVVGLIVIILAFAQFGAVCSWYLINTTSPPFLVILITAILGGIMGCFFMLFLLAPKGNLEDEEME